MTYVLNPFTSEFDYYVAALTGTEIITLLEALAAGSRLSHDDGLSDVSANDHHNQAHVLNASDHTVSGLTIGHFLKATGATTFAFAAHGLTYSDVGADISGAAAAVQSNLDTHAIAADPHTGYALESILGTSIGTGLLLTTTVLSVSAILQKYHAIDPTANVQSFIGAANYAAMLALLTGQAGAAFSWNSQNLTSVGTIASSAVDVSWGGYQAIPALRIGADIGDLTTRTNATSKLGSIGTPHYTNAEENILLGWIYSQAAASSLNIGGGDANWNTVTSITLYTAADNVTLTGTARLAIDSVGNVNIASHDAVNVGLKLGGALFKALPNGAGAIAWGSENFTGVGTIACGAITATDAGAFTKSQNSLTAVGITNTNAGNAARSGLAVTVDHGSGYFLAYGLNYAAVPDWAESFVLGVDAAMGGGVVFYSPDKVRVQHIAGTDILLISGGNVDVVSHNAATIGLKLGGTLVTISAAEANLLDGSIAGTIVNSKGVIYGASGEVNATTLEIGGNLLNITTDGTDTTVVGTLNVTALTGAAPGTLKPVYYNTTTKALSYDNT